MIDGSTEFEAGMVVIVYKTGVKCNALGQLSKLLVVSHACAWNHRLWWNTVGG